jgi:hypothetical protein
MLLMYFDRKRFIGTESNTEKAVFLTCIALLVRETRAISFVWSVPCLSQNILLVVIVAYLYHALK